MNAQQFFQSKQFKWTLAGIGGVIILLLVFQAGVWVGFRKADYSYRWGDNYHRMFGGPRGGFMHGGMDDMMGRDFTSGHGTAGAIVKIDGNNLVIKGQDGVEKIAVVTAATSVRRGNADIKLADLKADESVVVIGSPRDDGSIDAKIIRVFDAANPPPPPGSLHMPMFK